MIIKRAGEDVPLAHSTRLSGSDCLVDGESKGTGGVADFGNLALSSQDICLGSNFAWRTVLGSVIEVEGVGEVGVARLLQEIWKRGGGDVVTSQSLWPSIITGLSLPTDPLSHGVHITTPSTQASLALQKLYNIGLRSWEPIIFTGLIASFEAAKPSKPGTASDSSQPRPVAEYGVAPYTVLGGVPSVCGPYTLVKEVESSHGKNVTLVTDPLASPSVVSPAGSALSSSAFEIGDVTDNAHRSLSTNWTDQRESSNRIHDLIEALEEDRGEHERQVVAQAAAISSIQDPHDVTKVSTPGIAAGNALHLQMPDTDWFASPGVSSQHPLHTGSCLSNRKDSSQLTTPESAPSPFSPTTTNDTSSWASIPTTFTTVQAKSSQAGPAKPASRLGLFPASPSLPPMCMFFFPSFRDLKQDKVGVWKGDLDIKGKGGGKFSVLIVGEELTGHLWQSHTWPATITYPLSSTPSQAYTATMIPVSRLVGEGFTPAAMGMVLCDDANLSQYVAMVHGMHTEGLAFYLPNAANLPVVFFPAKFSSADSLQRLGIAYVTKPGFSLPPRPSTSTLVSSFAAAGGCGRSTA